LGKSSTLNLSFTPSVPAAGSSSSNQWTLVVSDSESAGAIIGEYTINIDATREGGDNFICRGCIWWPVRLNNG
jgi:flagellar hook protein FlgE